MKKINLDLSIDEDSDFMGFVIKASLKGIEVILHKGWDTFNGCPNLTLSGPSDILEKFIKEEYDNDGFWEDLNEDE